MSLRKQLLVALAALLALAAAAVFSVQLLPDLLAPAGRGSTISLLKMAVVLLVGCAAFLALERRVIHRISVLTEAFGKLESGDLSARVFEDGGDELASLARSFNRAAISLESADQKYRLLFEAFPHPILLSRLDGAYIDVNPAFERLAGLKREETIGRSATDLGFDQPEAASKVREQLTATGRIENEPHSVRLPDGNARHVIYTARLLPLAGEQVVLTVLVDVSDLKRTAEALLESEERFRATFEQAAVGIAQVSPDGRFMRLNRRFCEIVGYTPDEMIALTFQDITYPADLQADLAHVRELIEGRIQTYSMEKRYVRKNGSSVWVNLTVALVRGPDGAPKYFISVIEDIGKRKAVEETHARLVGILEGTSDLVATAGRDGRLTYMNRAGRALIGWGQDEELAAHVISDVHPEWAFALVTEAGVPTAIEKGNWVGESALLRVDGAEIPVSQVIIAHKSPDGEMVYLSTIMRDNAERQLLESRLSRSEAKYRGIFDCSIAAVYLFDTAKRFVDANRAGVELLGYSREELLGMRIPDVDADPTAVLPAHQQLLDGERLINYEHRLRRKDGRIITVLNNSSAVRDDAGQVTGMISTLLDITERKQAEDLLRESEKKFRTLHQSMMDAFVVCDLEGRIIEWNDAYADSLGYAPEELTTLTYRDITPEKWHAAEAAIVETQVLAKGYSDIYEKEYRRKDGAVFPVELRTTLIRDARGAPSGMWAIVRDITERKRAEQALRYKEERYRAFIARTTEGVWCWDVDEPFSVDLPDEEQLRLVMRGRISEANDVVARQYGFSRAEEIINRSFGEFIDEEEFVGLCGLLVASRYNVSDVESEERDSAGNRVFFVNNSVGIIENRRLIRIWGTQRDITERKRAEEALRHSEVTYRSIFNAVSDAIWVHDLDTGEIIDVNASVMLLFGYTVEEARRLNVGDISSGIHPFTQETAAELLRKAAGGEPQLFEWHCRHKDGHVFWSEVRLSRGTIAGRECILAIERDITERKRAEAEVRASEKKCRMHFANVSDVIYSVDRNAVVTTVSPSIERYLGYTPEEVLGKSFLELNLLTDRSLRAAAHNTALVLSGERIDRAEYEFIAKDGSIHYGEVSGSPVVVDGQVVAVVAVARDITERKRAEEERVRLEEQLQQAMKMEAVGRLAGGVAHDFNNMLAGILGYTEMALERLEADDPLHQDLEEVRKAAQQSADITRQLLAFSRKQLIEPRVVNLNELLDNMHKMLTRLIGEDVELRTVPGRDLGAVRLDPGQFDQVLVNLAVNARDAMPDGGALTIETANVELDGDYCEEHPSATPGRFVMIAVSDTGGGMSNEVKAHLFEPFFTTKGQGKGTGLGLATIYGAVRQSGGHIEVYSEVGEGTTFKICLPQVEEKAEALEVKNRAAEMPGGNETVLLVEDEDFVRNLSIKVLKRLGYKVLPAASGGDALVLVEQRAGPIHLLLTDVVMPGINGRVLAERVVKLHPSIKVLYTSGYTEAVIGHHGVIDAGLHFLGKPYSPRDLARKLREVLEESPQPREQGPGGA